MVLGGGVAANRGLRARMTEVAASRGVEVFVPPLASCTDNAAMIAYAGALSLARGEVAGLDLTPATKTTLARLNADGGVTLIPPQRGASAVRVDGTPLQSPVECRSGALRRGVILDFAGCVLVLLHAHDVPRESLPKFGLVGESAAIHQVRAEILRAAALSGPVLIRGESGTG